MNKNHLPQINDNEDCILICKSTELNQVQPKKTRGPNREYREINRFPDYESSLRHMRENITSYHHRYNKDTQEGNKQYYSCNGYDKCPKTIYILLHSTSMDCSIWESTENHNHQAKETKLPKPTVELVKQCLQDGLRSNKDILNKIKDQKLPPLTVLQLNNLKARIRNQTNDAHNSTLSGKTDCFHDPGKENQMSITKIRQHGTSRLTAIVLLTDSENESTTGKKESNRKRKAAIVEESESDADDKPILVRESKKSKPTESHKPSTSTALRRSTRKKTK